MDLPETTLWWTQQQQQQPILVVEPIQNPSTSGPPFHPSWPLQHHQPTWFNSHPPGDPPLPYNPTTTTPHFNLNNQNDDDEEEEEENDDDNNNSSDVQATTTQEGAELEDEKEAMFEKPLTPSDVGKLNRLVIPKQHAEKYFPLGASGGGDSGECNGLLLSFEDESGKCWRFRYSYWNSSQSYVLTKGWSRYVKDKRLYAGDVVLFERHRADNQRLFIGWRRRGPSGTDPAHVSKGVGHDGNSDGKNEVGVGGGGRGRGVGVGWTRGFYSAHPYPAHQLLPYQQDCLHAVRGSQGQNQRTRSVGNSSSSSPSSRVLRLFGVNMECQPEQHDSGTSTPQCSYNSTTMPSTQGTDTQHFYHYHQHSSHSPNPHPHMVRHQPYYY